MKICSFLLLTGVAMAVLISDVSAEEFLKGSSAVFVIDQTPELNAKPGNKVDRYTPAIKPGPHKWMIAVAKAPPNSTVLMVAFEPDSERLYRNIPPVIFDQTASSGVARFPNPKSNARWPYQNEVEKLELFVFIFTTGDPEAANLRNHAAGVIEAMSKKQEDIKSLHAANLKSEIASQIRRRSNEKYIVRYPSVSIAGTLRGGGIHGKTKLPDDWNKRSNEIAYLKGMPGLLLFRIPPGN